MLTRFPLLAPPLLAVPFAASPAEAAYLGCNPNDALPADPAGRAGCFTDLVVVTCAALAVVCGDGSAIVVAEGESTAPVTWALWLRGQHGTWSSGPHTSTSLRDIWNEPLGPSTYAEAWLKVNGRTVASTSTGRLTREALLRAATPRGGSFG